MATKPETKGRIRRTTTENFDFEKNGHLPPLENFGPNNFPKKNLFRRGPSCFIIPRNFRKFLHIACEKKNENFKTVLSLQHQGCQRRHRSRRFACLLYSSTLCVFGVVECFVPITTTSSHHYKVCHTASKSSQCARMPINLNIKCRNHPLDY